MTGQTSALTEDTRVMRARLLEEEFEDGFVLYSYESGTLTRVASTSAAVWACLTSTTSAREIAAALAEAYQAPAELVLRDVLALLEELITSGLLLVTESE